jgi:glycosyltransferase involved in cell wall biosynthesis
MVALRHPINDPRVMLKQSLTLKKAGFRVTLMSRCGSDGVFYDSASNAINDVCLLEEYSAGAFKAEYQQVGIIGVVVKSGLGQKWLHFYRAIKLLTQTDARVYHAHEPEMSLLVCVIAKIIKKFQGVKILVIHDGHEWPPAQSYDTSRRGFKNLNYSAHILYDYLIGRFVDHGFSANSIVRGYLMSCNPMINVDILYNAPPSKYRVGTKQFIHNQKLRVCHEGVLTFDRGLENLLACVKELREDVELVIVGDAFNAEKRWLSSYLDEHGLRDTVRVTGWLGYEDVFEELKKCDVGLITFTENYNNRMAGPPNKLFNYMASGLPVISVNYPELKFIVETAVNGYVISSDQKELEALLGEIASNRTILKELSENGLKAFDESYSWEHQAFKLNSAYSSLLERVGEI